MVLFLLPSAADLRSQERLETGAFILSGQIISPRGDFQDSFKVQLYRDSVVPLAEYRVQPLEHFAFYGLSGGVYFIVADIPGFKRINERIDLNGQRRTTFSIFLEERPERIVERPMDLVGREDLLVDVADLAARPREIVDEIRDAREDLMDGDLETARQRLEEVVREAPEFYNARMLLGAAYQKLMQYREAETEFKTAANLRPELSAPWTNLGGLYLQEAKTAMKQGDAAVRGVLNDAIGSLLRAVDLNPNAALAHYLLGVGYLEANLYEDAEDSLVRSIQLEPRFSTAHLALANVYIELQEWPAAMMQIDNYLEGNPDPSWLCRIQTIRSQIAGILEAEENGQSLPEPRFATADVVCSSDGAQIQANP